MPKSLKKLLVGAMVSAETSISAIVTLTAMTDVANAQSASRSHVRCPNGGRVNGKFYCNVTKVTQGGAQSSSAKLK